MTREEHNPERVTGGNLEGAVSGRHMGTDDHSPERTTAVHLAEAGDSNREKAASLLLLLCRVEFTDEEKHRVSHECKSFNEWRLFTDLALRHGVAALVWQNMCDLDVDRYVTDSDRAMLEGLRLRSVARVTFITTAAAGVVDILEKEGIRVVLLKGLALEHTVYGSRGLRQMSDADMLVTPGEALRARDIMSTAGFESMPMKSRLYRHIMLDLGNHLPEMHRGGISVDLHYRLFGPEGEEMVRRAINEAEEITTGGKRFHVLPPVSAFLGLVSHIHKHEIKGEFQLRLYADIYLLLKKHGDTIISPHLMTEADKAGISSEVRVVMTVMEQVWQLEIPAEMKARPGREEGKADLFMHDLMYPGLITPENQRDMFTRNLHSMRGLRKKLIFIAGDIFPSVDFMKRRYGRRSSLSVILHYPHRLGKIIWIFSPEKDKKRDK